MTLGTARLGWLALAAIAIGCGAEPAPLRPQDFIRPQPGLTPGSIPRPVDQNGTLVYGELHAPLLPDQYTNDHPHLPVVVSPVVRQVVAASQPSGPATLPAAAAPPEHPGLVSTYQVVGSVVAVVNGHPIYADKVLASLDQELATDARRFRQENGTLDFGDFQRLAAGKIDDRVVTLVRAQLKIAAAGEFLSANDKLQADHVASMWRDQQIYAAGGSVELARERAIRDFGTTLDQQVQDRRDELLVELYYQEHLFPLITVTPADMLNYYRRNLQSKFTETAQAKFRVIKIDVARRGGPEAAVRVVNDILEQLRHGADFAKLAGQINDDDLLLKRGGDEGWVLKDNFAVDEVERAVWKLRPGQFTDPAISVRTPNGDAYFYIAQLEAVRPGTVRKYEDVQESIRDLLWREQLGALVERNERELERQAVIFRVPNGEEAVVEMAMQRFPIWAGVR